MQESFIRDMEMLRRASDARLDRIETKIDQLSEAMITLARAEEKLLNFEKNNMTMNNTVNRIIDKVEVLEEEITSLKTSNSILNKAVFILTAAAATAIFSQILPPI